MSSDLVNSVLTSVCSDFSLTECSAKGTSGHSAEDGCDRNKYAASCGRDILDLQSNLTSEEFWAYQATVLPRRDIKMFLTHRSVYHRCQGHPMEISGVENCKCCGFPIPVIL